VLRKLGRFADSARELERARALEPSGSDIYVQLGLSYEALGKPDAAEDTYRRALTLNPRNRTARELLGKLTQGD
jgi:Flp pilus assembly protein TadD